MIQSDVTRKLHRLAWRAVGRALVLGGLAWAASAGAQPEAAQLTARWEIAEQARYEVTRTRLDQRAGQPDRAGRGRSVVEIVARGAEPGESRHEWTYASASIEGGPGGGDLGEQLLGSLQALSVQFRLDSDANILGLANAAQVRSALMQAIGEMLKTLERSSPRPVPTAQVQRMLMGMVADDQQLLQLVSKEAQVLYAPYGGAFEFGTTHRLKSQVPTPFSPQPIATDNEIEVSALDVDSGTYLVTMTESLDPADVQRVLSAVLAQMAQGAGLQLPPGELPGLQMRRKMVYRLQLQARWPLAVDWEQTIEMPGGSRRDTMQLKLLPG